MFPSPLSSRWQKNQRKKKRETKTYRNPDVCAHKGGKRKSSGELAAFDWRGK